MCTPQICQCWNYFLKPSLPFSSSLSNNMGHEHMNINLEQNLWSFTLNLHYQMYLMYASSTNSQNILDRIGTRQPNSFMSSFITCVHMLPSVLAFMLYCTHIYICVYTHIYAQIMNMRACNLFSSILKFCDFAYC